MPHIVRSQDDSRNLFLDVGGVWYHFDTTSPPIGEGAMGIVYLGFRCDNNEQVAIKQIRPELWDNSLIRNRCKLEASIVLNHPNVVRMIGFCEEEPDTGPLYILSEYISGITLEEHVREQLSCLSLPQRDRKIIEEFIPIIDAVSYLHSQGIIHRDIKPSNIMLQDGFLPKLMDLGVAKADCFFDAHLEGTIGSAPFAAPEQIVPDNVEASVDTRSDIYSLGATLQFLLTGCFPSDLHNHSALLRNILEIATEDNPDNRYQDADLFKDALVSILNESNIKTKKPFPIWVIVVIILIVIVLFTLLVL